MAKEKFSQLPIAPTLTSMDYFIGIRDNNDGTFSNYLFTYAQIAALAASGANAIITVAESSPSLTDSFFADHTISLIISNGQTYVASINFTQSGDTITGIDIQFYENQILQARV